MTPAPESPEVVSARARAIVARHAHRRPAAVVIASPLIRQEQTPQRYAPVSLSTPPSVTWEQAQAEEAAREPWADIGERLATSLVLTTQTQTRRMPWAPVAPGVIPMPEVPELLPGADAAGRKARLDRAGAALRALAELPALLAGEPPAVAARAKAAILRAAGLSSAG